MRFLADQSCDFGVVRALREAGHDVRAIAEDAPDVADAEVAADAAADKRVLVTEDKDFGQLVFSGVARQCSIIRRELIDLTLSVQGVPQRWRKEFKRCAMIAFQ